MNTMLNHLQTSKENGEAYNNLARQYDEVMAVTPYYANIRGTEERLLNRVLRQTGITKVVDIGCGTGFATMIAAETGKSVLGVDPCPQMLEIANSKTGRFAERIKFKCGSAESLPVPPQSADLVVAFGSVLNHCGDWGIFFSELRRTIRPRGQIIITVDNLLGMDSFTWATFRLIRGKGDGVVDLSKRISAWWNRCAHLNHWPLETPTKSVNVRLRYERASLVIKLLSEHGFRVRRIEGSNMMASFSPEIVLSSAHLRNSKGHVGFFGKTLMWLDRKFFFRWWLLGGTYVIWAESDQ